MVTYHVKEVAGCDIVRWLSREEREIGRGLAYRQAGYYDDYDLLRFFRLKS
jgi:hypothetical protein